MPSRKDRKSRTHNELVLLEVLESAQQLFNNPNGSGHHRRPTTRLCLASAAALLLAAQASETNLNGSNVDSEEQGLASRDPVEMTMIELTDVEIQQLKEQNHRRIKRVVTVVAITMMLISFILVALSLSLGPKIDSLVSESLDGELSSKDLFLGPKKNNDTFVVSQ